MTIVLYVIMAVLILGSIYLGLGAYVGKLYYQDSFPKNKKVSRTEKAKLIIGAIGLTLSWGPLLIWIIIDDKIKGNHI